MTDIRQQIGVPFALEPLWAMEPNAFERLREMVSTAGPDRLAAAATPSAAGVSHPGYENRGGVAVIQFSGAVTKHPSLWAKLFGGAAVTTDTRAALAGALADPSVNSILMVIDSPGGTISGVNDLAADVAAASALKPVCAYAEDMCASAAYWVGSQAGRLVGNATASVGSIGVFAAVPDISRLAKNLGVEMNVVKSVAGKGGGTAGAPVTEAQLAEVQRMVNAIHTQFAAAVNAGRGRDMGAVCDGRVYMGQEAVDLGLLDAIEPLNVCIAKMQAAAEPKAEILATATYQEEPTMSDKTPTVEVTLDTTKANEELAALQTKLDAAEKQLADVKSAQAAIDAAAETTSLIAAARAERKLTPALAATAEVIAKSGVEPLKAFLGALPAASAPDGGSVSETRREDASGPKVRHVADHVGVALHAFKPETAPAHMAAVEFMEKANAAGKQISYFDAVVAVTRR